MARQTPMTPFAAAIAAIITAITAILVALLAHSGNTVNGYDDCVAAGNPVISSYPPRCVTKDGRSFTQPIP